MAQKFLSINIYEVQALKQGGGWRQVCLFKALEQLGDHSEQTDKHRAAAEEHGTSSQSNTIIGDCSGAYHELLLQDFQATVWVTQKLPACLRVGRESFSLLKCTRLELHCAAFVGHERDAAQIKLVSALSWSIRLRLLTGPIRDSVIWLCMSIW